MQQFRLIISYKYAIKQNTAQQKQEMPKFILNSALKFYKSDKLQNGNRQDQSTLFNIERQNGIEFNNVPSIIDDFANPPQKQDILDDFQRVLKNSKVSQIEYQQCTVQKSSPMFRNVFNDDKNANNRNQSKKRFIQTEFNLNQLQRDSVSLCRSQQQQKRFPSQENKFQKLYNEIIQKQNDSIQKYAQNSVQQSFQQNQFPASQLQANLNGIKIGSGQISVLQQKMIIMQQKFLKQRQKLYRQKFVLERQNSIKQAKIKMLEKSILEKRQRFSNYAQYGYKQPLKTIIDSPQKRQYFTFSNRYQRAVKQKDKLIQQFLTKIEQLNNKMNQKNAIISQLAYDKVKLQTTIQHLTNRIFILEKRQENHVSSPRVHIQSFKNNVAKIGPPITRTEGRQHKNYSNRKKLVQNQESINKSPKFLKSNRIEAEQRKNKTRTLNNTIYAPTHRQFLIDSLSPGQNKQLRPQNILIKSQPNKTSPNRFFKLTKNKTNVY